MSFNLCKYVCYKACFKAINIAIFFIFNMVYPFRSNDISVRNGWGLEPKYDYHVKKRSLLAWDGAKGIFDRKLG